MSIENFWGDYEVGGAPAHHAKIKSVVSGKPETYTHAGQTESSDAYPNLSKQHFDAHSRRAQNFLLKHLLEAKHPGLKNIGGVPHVTLYRGVKGKYAESILEKFGAHKSHPINPEIEAKRVSVKHLPAGSWSLEPEQARTFAATGSMDADGKVSPPRHGVVIKKDFPVSSVLHVGFGNYYPDKPTDAGQHYSEEEKEVVVHHPKERLVLSHNNLESIKVPGRDSFKKPGVVGVDGQIKKSHPTPTFPKLGLGDDRRETPYVATPKAVKEKLHTVTASSALHPGNADMPRQTVLEQTKQVARKKFRDAQQHMTGTRGSTTNAETGVQSGYALAGDFAPRDSQIDNQASVRGTKLHEDLHMMMNRVHKKYGAQGRQNLADNMYRAIPIQYRPAVDRYFEHKSGGVYKPHQITEEKLASVLNFMNSKTDRRAFHNSLNQLEDPSHEPQQFDQHMHRAYKAMLAAGGAADETWATHQKMFKSESDINPQDGIAHILHSSHDRHEKLLALKHRSVTPWDLKIALHDEDPVVREFAVNHPMADESVKRYAAEQDNTEFAKNVPLLLFPKLGEHTAHSSPMFVSHTDFANKVKDGTAHNLGYTKASVRQQVQTPAEAQYLRAGVNVDAHKQKDPVARAKALNGTAQHEAQHMVFRRLDQRYGRQNATPKVLEHLYNGLDTDQKRAVATVFAAAKGPRAYAKESFKEEALTHLHQYLGDPGFRAKVHANLKLDENSARELQSQVKGAHQKLRTVAESLTPEHLGIFSKSDTEILSEFSENLLKNHGNVNLDLVSDSLGVDLELAEYIKAVEFLTGKKLDEREVRRRMHTQDLSAAEAALDVAGANTEDARKSIEALVGIENVAKAEKDVQIQEFRPEGKEFADSVRQAYKYDQVEPVKLAGKHSSGALIARDLDGNSLLLKPGSGNLSPAAGIRQENATQSRREGAFYAVADLLGLAQYLPKTELVSVGATEYAVMDLLPIQYQNLFKQVKVDPGLARRVFESYRIDGTLARWSALDWICSNVDRHGQNLMFAPNEHGGYDVKLIDHGSTFAGDQFNPGNDPDGKGGYNSFVPYYLRYGAPKGKFHQLDTQAKLRYMAQTPATELSAFQQWLDSIDTHKLMELLHSFGISHEAVLERLGILKAAAAYGFEAVNRLWIIGKPVSASNSPSETP